MNILLLFIIIISLCGVSSTSYENREVLIEADSRGVLYVVIDSLYYRITNANGFRITPGMSISSFTTDEIAYTSKLSSYKLKKESEIYEDSVRNRSLGGWSTEFFGRTNIKIAVMRIVFPRFSAHPYQCNPIPFIEGAIQQLDHAMRLWSGNQIGLNVSGCFISECYDGVTDEEYADRATHSKKYNGWYSRIVNAYPWPAGVKTRDFPTIAVSFADINIGGGGIGAVANVPRTWFFNSQTRSCVISGYFMDEIFFTPFVHEIGHNMGFNHAGGNKVSVTGQLLHYNMVNGYGDYANYMGSARWYNPIGSRHYYYIVTNGYPQPWYWFKLEEEGSYTVRLYAYDHPYSKYFFGVTSPYHNDNEIFDGVEMKYNCISLEIPFDKERMVSGIDSGYSYISTILEYRYLPKGQRAWNAKSLRWLWGPVKNMNGGGLDVKKDNLLDIDIDGMTGGKNGWGDGQLPLGVTWTPRDIDKGTMSFRVTRMHPGTLAFTTYESIDNVVQRNYDEPAYVDVKITYKPGVAFVKPTTPPKFPTYITSPSIISCTSDESKNTMNCECQSKTFWLIGKSEDDDNIPRVYSNGEVFIDGRKAISSYIGYSYDFYHHCFGETINHRCIKITVKGIPDSGITNVKLWHDSTISIGPDNNHLTFSYAGNSIFAIVPNNPSKLTLSDPYGSVVDVSSSAMGTVLFHRLPDFKVDGLFEGGIRIHDVSGKIISSINFQMTRGNNTDRVAFVKNMRSGKYEISAASIPVNKFTSPTMLFSQTVKANENFYYPIVHLQRFDYIYIDIEGIIPSSLIIEAEVENGIAKFDLSELSGYKDISYKIVCNDIINMTKGWCDFNYFKFNNEITLLSIREVLSNQFGEQRKNRNNIETDGFNYNGERYGVIINPIKIEYIPFKKTIGGIEYDFDNIERFYELGNNKKPTPPTPSTPKPIPIPDISSNEKIRFVIKTGGNENNVIVYKLKDKTNRIAEIFSSLKSGENKKEFYIRHEDYYIEYGNKNNKNVWKNSEIIISIVDGPMLFNGSYDGSEELNSQHLIIKNYMKSDKNLRYSDSDPEGDWKKGESINNWNDGSVKLNPLQNVVKRYYYKSINFKESKEDIISFYIKMKICGKAKLFMNSILIRTIDKSSSDDYIEFTTQSDIINVGINHLAIELENEYNIEKDVFEISQFIMLNVDPNLVPLPTIPPPTINPSDLNLINENSEWEYSDIPQYTLAWTFFSKNDIDNWKKSSSNGFAKKSVISRYYRNTFTIESDFSIVGCPKLELKISEGVIIYINGYEIYRNNLESGLIEPNTKAIKSYDLIRTKKIMIPLSVIYRGKNIICIEIHEHLESLNKIDSFNLKLGISESKSELLITPKNDVNFNYYTNKPGLAFGNPYGRRDEYDNMEKINKFKYAEGENDVFPWNTTISFKNDEARYFDVFRLAGCTNDANTHPKSIIVYGSSDKDNDMWEELYRNDNLEFEYHTDTAEISSCSDELRVTIPNFKSYEIFKVSILKTRSYNHWIQFRLLTFSQSRPKVCESEGEYPSAFGNSIVRIACDEVGYKSVKCKENGYWDKNVDESMCNVYPTVAPPTINPEDSLLIDNEFYICDTSQNDLSWSSYFKVDEAGWRKTDVTRSVTTRYYRNIFTIKSNLTAISYLTLSITFNHGIVLYINGKEIYRKHLPKGNINSETLAIGSNSPISAIETITISPSLLQRGINYIAFEIHTKTKPAGSVVEIFTGRLEILNSYKEEILVTPNSDVIITSFPNSNYLMIDNETESTRYDYENMSTVSKFLYYKENIENIASEEDVLPWTTIMKLNSLEARCMNTFKLGGCNDNSDSYPNNIKIYAATDVINPDWEEIYSNISLNNDEGERCENELSIRLKSFKSYGVFKVIVFNTVIWNGYIQFKQLSFVQNRIKICEADGDYPMTGGGNTVRIDCDISGYESRKCDENGKWLDPDLRNCEKKENPTTLKPTTEKPTTVKPTTIEPTTQKPATIKPTTQKPTTIKPITEKPTTEKPTTVKPTTEKPTTLQPTTQTPTTQIPTTSNPTATTLNPTTVKPTTVKPTTEKPTTLQPTTQTPTTQTPTTQIPTATTLNPTSEIPTTPGITSIKPPTEIPSTLKPIEKVEIIIRISNVKNSVLSELSESDRIIIKDSLIEIYKREKIELKREDIEIEINENHKLLLRRLQNEMSIRVVITKPEKTTKEEIIKVAEQLLLNNKLKEEIIAKSEASSEEKTILKDADIEVVEVEGKRINPTNSNDIGGKDDDKMSTSTIIITGIVVGVVIVIIVIIVFGIMAYRSRKEVKHGISTFQSRPIAEKGVMENKKNKNTKEIEMTELPVVVANPKAVAEVKPIPPPPPKRRTPPPPPKREQ